YKELFKLSNNAQVGEWTLFPIKDSKNLKRTWDDIVRENVGIVCENRIYIWYHETGRIEEIASSLKEFIISYSEGVEEDE
ncbi:MAG: SMI1/KNR4 family protein, partial [Anaerobacillus sp.]